MNPKVLVLTGAGLNCERESARALEAVGFDANICHIIDLIANPELLDEHQMMMFVGGFSYGDHSGAAMVLAEEIRRIEAQLQRFVEKDKLVLGVCNGCQVLLRLGLIANSDWRFRQNSGGEYECRWVNVAATRDTAFFQKGAQMPIPIGHGEGRLFGGDASEIALQYVDAAGALANGQYPANPNGAEADAAGVTAHNGRVLAMMPHPERGFYNWQRPDFTKAKALAKRNDEHFDPDGLTPAAVIFKHAFAALK